MSAAVLVGDALEQLRSLPSGSVHCVVTSPPYWGLRDYGVDGQIGLEASLAEFLAKLVAVFEEVRRVLRDDGTCWVNMGDCYVTPANTGTGWNSVINGKGTQIEAGRASRAVRRTRASTGGLKQKDLVGQPWRLAFALQDAGWYLRRDIIWHKPNPMPETVHDRPTTAHEYLFLLSKSQRYHYDAGAIRERASSATHRPVAGWAAGPGSHSSIDHNRDRMTRPRARHGDRPACGTRNRRSVWTIPVTPFRGAHFATFPRKLVEPCILAGCPVGGLVLDPFAGSGTTGVVAVSLGRSFLGIELNPSYAEMARSRLVGVQMRVPGVA